MDNNNIQNLVVKIRALIIGETEAQRSIRDKVEKTYRTKREPKVKK